MPDQIPKEVVQDRYERLVKRINDITWHLNLDLVGQEVEVLVAHGEGRKDRATDRLSGRAADGRLVHIDMKGETARPGDFVTARIISAAPHHMLAEHIHTRPTRAGDFSDYRPSGPAVMLGIPTFAP
jgi:tRNA-2-methylthio-N6-dimethylallyladenosine synthase